VLLKIVYLLTCRVLGLAVVLFRGDRAKDAELLVLRHENAVLRRHASRVQYEPADRMWLAALARLLLRSRWTDIFPATPATLLAWHRKLAGNKYDTSKRRKKVTELTSLGPPKLSGGSVAARMITLNEVTPGTPTWKLNLNARPHGDGSQFTETLTWNSVEDWYFVNTTPDTHPMHTHLVTFKVMGRYNYDVDSYAAKYGTANGVPQLDVSTLRPFLKSGLIDPGPDEAGLKETVKANPGQVTVVRARFSLPSTALNGAGKLVKPQKYVHHCHIVEHEDNDMMERMIVVP
jgi:FtsP/CotA-like multicopper oxidase with cupredoxin domain